jgi:hypothetical protein
LDYKVVACNTLKDEINKVIIDLNLNIEINWVDSGLHNYPDKLNKRIQKNIDQIKDTKNILLLFGYCGRSIEGIKSTESRIIFPDLDDCISLFLGGIEPKEKLQKKAPAYYFTRGYLENEYNIWSEYKYCVDKYGEKRSKMIMKRMFKNYKLIRVIDTKAFNLDKILSKTKMIANEFDLGHEVIEGDLSILYKAFQQNWDNDFIIKNKGKKICLNDLGFDLKMSNCSY